MDISLERNSRNMKPIPLSQPGPQCTGQGLELLAIALLCFPALLPGSTIAEESETSQNLATSSIWLGGSISQYDYFSRYPSETRPDGFSLGASHFVNEDWMLSASINKQSAKEVWQVDFGDLGVLSSGAETETKAYAIGVSWFAEDFALSATYSQIDTVERALSRVPAIIESLESDDSALSFSYDSSTGMDSWILDYSIGIQYLETKSFSRQAFIGEPPTVAAADYDPKSWSLYLDLTMSYWMEQDSFSWAPSFSFGWTAEVSTDGEPVIVIARGEERRLLTRVSDQLLDSFRIPDSGYLEFALNFDWENNWSSSFSINQTLSSEPDILSLDIDVGFSF
ncbi:hypothetical protein [Aliikangiella sp. G2MR2-5]|uniref:hypothetical protein n=1 Tax=Aliikangiella sp. G2MR2-5 TaxID=2788943 RepID=UPI0018A9DFF2|nr:hypothetical protein [Aliikangiella sp. G2MR2-5]